MGKLMFIFVFGVTTSTGLFAQSEGVSSSRAAAPQPSTNVDLGARIGIVDVDSLGDPLLSVGIFSDYNVSDNVVLEGTLDYWQKDTGTIADRSVSVSDVALGALGKFVFTEPVNAFRPYIGAGLSAHRFELNYERKKDDDAGKLDKFESTDNDVQTELGLDLVGGALYQVQQRLNAMAEVKYRSITNSDVDLDQIALQAGLAYKL